MEVDDSRAWELVVDSASPLALSVSDRLPDDDDNDDVAAIGARGGDAGSVSVYQAVAPNFGRPLRALCCMAAAAAVDSGAGSTNV